MFQTLDPRKTGLKSEAIKMIQDCLGTFPKIDQAIIYGSRAKGTFRNGSDIDLSFIGENLTQNDLLKIDLALDDLLTPYSFDLSIFHSIDNPNLIDHIKRVGMVFYS